MTAGFFLLMRLFEHLILSRMAAEREERHDDYESLFDEADSRDTGAPLCPHCGQPTQGPADAPNTHGAATVRGQGTRPN